MSEHRIDLSRLFGLGQRIPVGIAALILRVWYGLYEGYSGGMQ